LQNFRAYKSSDFCQIKFYTLILKSSENSQNQKNDRKFILQCLTQRLKIILEHESSKKNHQYIENENVCEVCLGSISPTFYKQFLCSQIPKVQKDTDDLAVFFCAWDLCAKKHLVKCWWNQPHDVCDVFECNDMINLQNIFPFYITRSVLKRLWFNL